VFSRRQLQSFTEQSTPATVAFRITGVSAATGSIHRRIGLPLNLAPRGLGKTAETTSSPKQSMRQEKVMDWRSMKCLSTSVAKSSPTDFYRPTPSCSFQLPPMMFSPTTGIANELLTVQHMQVIIQLSCNFN
jgi:hypothetical protein